MRKRKRKKPPIKAALVLAVITAGLAFAEKLLELVIKLLDLLKD